MIKNFDDMQKIGKDNMDASMKSFGAVSKSFQAIAVEAADYAKKAFEESTAASEKLAAAKSLDKVMEVQADYLKQRTRVLSRSRRRSASSMSISPRSSTSPTRLNG